MRYYYYDYSAFDENVNVINRKSSDDLSKCHHEFLEINPDNVHLYDVESFSHVYESFRKMQDDFLSKKSKPQWFKIDNGEGAVSDDPFGLMLCDYLYALSQKHYHIGDYEFFVCVSE